MKKFVYDNKPTELCYGCRACEQICPTSAILIIENEEGFIYPHIDSEKCIECELCKRVCPTQDANRKRIVYPDCPIVYTAWNKNLKERMQSTSGGIFYLIAKWIIEQKGSVFGAVFSSDMKPIHRRGEKIEDIELMRGSKYAQSDTNDTYSQVKKDLTNGQTVLYTGTPCQIAGLKSFLKKKYENLYTIDLVCHGTPSAQLFVQNIKSIKEKEKSDVLEYQFRAKRKGYWTPLVSYTLANGKKRYLTVGENFYGAAFYNNWIHRKSCYLCEFSNKERCGDITLSDFWGIEQHYSQLKKIRRYGLNMIMCNSEKGIHLFNSIKSNIEFIECTVDIAYNSDPRLIKAESQPKIRDVIYNEYKLKGYQYIEKRYHNLSLIQKILPLWIKETLKKIQSLYK